LTESECLWKKSAGVGRFLEKYSGHLQISVKDFDFLTNSKSKPLFANKTL
jgi:activator of 2-hydroxyglutaryl-CoA dehydratase